MIFRKLELEEKKALPDSIFESAPERDNETPILFGETDDAEVFIIGIDTLDCVFINPSEDEAWEPIEIRVDIHGEETWVCADPDQETVCAFLTTLVCKTLSAHELSRIGFDPAGPEFGQPID